MIDSTLIMVYTTFPDQEQASVAAQKLVNSRLAVCVNISNGQKAFYQQNQECVECNEVGVMIKTLEDRYESLYEFLHKIHPYSIPMILSWPAAANKSYTMWAMHQSTLMSA